MKSDADDADDPQNPSRQKYLDEHSVNPNGTKSTTTGDDSSTHSRKSSTSLSSWAAKLFVGGNGHSQSKDESTETLRNRTPPTTDIQPRGRTTSGGNPKGSMSAMAALKRINNTSTSPGASGRGSGPGSRANPAPRKTTGSNLAQGTTAEAVNRNSTNLGPVEMDAILPIESRPPTLTQTYNNYTQSGDLLLTDRFGFIYDQRRKKRQREAKNTNGNRLSIAETLGSFRSDNTDGAVDDDRDSQKTGAGSQRSPSSAASPDDPE